MITPIGQIIFNKQASSGIPPPGQISGLPPTVGNHKRLEEMVERSQRVLLKVHSKFPFDPFPDYLTIDENKVNFVYREFGSKRIHSVFIENISYVTCDTTPFSCTLNVTDSTSERFPVRLSISWLKHEDALKARRLIHGLMAVKKLGINFAEFETEQLIDGLVKLGEAKEVE